MLKSYSKKNQKGTTLLEVLISTAMTLIVVTVVFTILNRSVKLCSKVTDRNTLIRKKLHINDYLKRDIRRANVFQDPKEDRTLNRIILLINEYDSSGNMSTKKVLYSLAGNRLIRDVNDGSEKTEVTDGFESITFSNEGEGIITVNYILLADTKNQRQNITKLEVTDKFESLIIKSRL